jgi:Family of unknown function (DUF6049)
VAHLNRRGSPFPRKRRAVRVAWVIAIAGSVCAAPAVQAAASGGETTGAPSTPSIVLTSQTPWVKTGQPFALSVDIHANVAESDLAVTLSAYTPPEGQSSFDETIEGDTGNETLLSDTPLVQLKSLPASGSRYGLRVGITAAGYTAPPGALDLNLQCSAGSCSGVYPLRVQLMDTATGSVLAELVTYILFVESQVGSRLRVSLVTPFGSAPSAATSDGSQVSPSGSELERLGSIASALSASTTPVTVVPQPQTIQALESGGQVAKSVVSELAAVSDNATGEVLQSTYVWVDPEAVVHSGLSAELAAQSTRGREILDAAHVQTTGAASVLSGDIDADTLRALSESGLSEVVLPYGDLTPVTGRFSGPSVQTFKVALPNAGSMKAVQTNQTLENELADHQTVSGVLAANQLLADLALISFEDPDASWARGVVLSPDLRWDPPPGFLPTLLAGLADIPVLQPVTLSDFFSQVAGGDDGGNPDSGNGWPATRDLAGASGSQADFPAQLVTSARSQLSSLEGIVGRGQNLAPLGDLVLCAESLLLSHDDQAAFVSQVTGLVDKGAAVVTLTSARTIRLTSRTATIPITLVRQVPYPVTVLLDLSSEKLGFVHNSNPQKVTLDQHIQTVDVDVFARTAGDFPVVVSVKSPDGDLVIASVKFTVRSLSTSVVAIILTAVAACVLLLWWGKTLRSRRRQRKERPAHGAHEPSAQAHSATK